MQNHGIYSNADDFVITHAAKVLHLIDKNKSDEKALEKNLNLFMKYAYQLGLTPIARRNLGLPIGDTKEEEKENPFKLRKVK